MSVCTCCYFSSEHRHYVFLTLTDLYNPCLLLCHGALGGAGCCPLSYCLDLLTGRPGWTPDLTHYQPHPGCSTEPSPWLSWPCCATLPWPELHHPGSRLVSLDPLQLSPDGVGATSLSIPAGQNRCRAAVTRWQW